MKCPLCPNDGVIKYFGIEVCNPCFEELMGIGSSHTDD